MSSSNWLSLATEASFQCQVSLLGLNANSNSRLNGMSTQVEGILYRLFSQIVYSEVVLVAIVAWGVKMKPAMFKTRPVS
jgi:hypothetical protein